MIVFLSAMWDELKSIRSELRVERRFHYTNGGLLKGTYQGEPFVWMVSGIGRKNAEDAVDRLAQDPTIRGIILVGFGGGLSPDLQIGDMVICEQMRCESSASPVYQADKELVEICQRTQSELSSRLLVGESLTVERVITSPVRKHELVSNNIPRVVEMENYWIAEKANEYNLRFLAIRSISDNIGDRLPPFDQFLNKNGGVQVGQGLQHFASHPGDLNTLPRLYRNANLARKSLRIFFKTFYPRLMQGYGYAASSD